MYFGGVRCSSHTGTTIPRDDEEIYLEHQVGTACLHLGKHRHKALPINSGRRLNLIIWVSDDQQIQIHLEHFLYISLVSIVKF